MRIQKVDVAVIGSGPAGLAAAIAASSAGAEKVTILDRNKTLGGILPNVFIMVSDYIDSKRISLDLNIPKDSLIELKS